MITHITKAGIEQTIGNLNYQNPRLPKTRLIQAIMQYYVPEDALETLTQIDADILIKHIWETGDDPLKIASKKKNLSSIRSAINSDLKKLSGKDLNPEGIMIGPNYTFVMSDDNKEKLLSTFTTAAKIQNDISIDQITHILSIISEFITEVKDISLAKPGDAIKKILDLVKDLTDKMGIAENLEDYEFVKKEDIEEVDEDDIEEVDEDDMEEVDEDDIEEVDEDDIEEMDEEDIEEIDEDDIEEVDEDEIEEIDEDDIEEVDEDEIEEIDEDDIEEVDEDDIEEVDEDEIEEVDDDEIEEVDEDDIEEVDEDDIEEVDEDEIEEIDEDQVAIGLPEDNIDADEFSVDENMLAEQFDGYLGAMERHYNQYLKIPAGKYIVGSYSPGKKDIPARDIQIQEIYMGKFPVTNALFEIFVERCGYRTTAEELGYGWVYTGRFQKIRDEKTGIIKSVWNNTFGKKKVAGAFWYQPSGPGSTLHRKRNHPVVQVSPADALAFAAWTGKRLPSEFEWEAAARTQTGNKYPWGNIWDDKLCNHEKNAISDTTPVDNYPSGENAYGIADILGNILEWTGDETAPPHGKIQKTKFYIAKGGSWMSNSNIELSNRYRFEAGFTSNILGFRCVAD